MVIVRLALTNDALHIRYNKVIYTYRISGAVYLDIMFRKIIMRKQTHLLGKGYVAVAPNTPTLVPYKQYHMFIISRSISV